MLICITTKFQKFAEIWLKMAAVCRPGFLKIWTFNGHVGGSTFTFHEDGVEYCLELVGANTCLTTMWGNYIGKGSPYSITERRVPELIPVLGSQSAGDVNHKPGRRLPLLSARPAVTLTTLKRAATSFAAWWTEAQCQRTGISSGTLCSVIECGYLTWWGN